MAAPERCDRCGHPLTILSHPIRRLRWTRYWGKGVRSLFTGPMRVCEQCGAMYTNEGKLIAAGAIATEAERRLDVYRRDMAYLRDSFGGVIVAAELVALWLAFGSEGFALGKVVLAGAVGVAAFAPFLFFGRKARLAKRDLKQLREVRRSGRLVGSSEPSALSGEGQRPGSPPGE